MRSVPLRLSSQILLLLFLISAMGLISSGVGCSAIGVPQWRGSGFLREEFLQYHRVAVLPFEGDLSGDVVQTFTITFQDRFREMETVDRKKILTMFRREDLYPNRVNTTTRNKLNEMFGAQAIVTGQVYYPSIFSWILQVKIVDTATGQTLGHAYVEINYMGAEGIKEACQLVVQELKPQVDK